LENSKGENANTMFNSTMYVTATHNIVAKNNQNKNYNSKLSYTAISANET